MKNGITKWIILRQIVKIEILKGGEFLRVLMFILVIVMGGAIFINTWEIEELQKKVDAMKVVKLEESRLFKPDGSMESCHYRYWIAEKILLTREAYEKAREGQSEDN